MQEGTMTSQKRTSPNQLEKIDVWLVEDNSIGFLVFVAAALLALVVGLALSLSRFIKQRSYEKVHGISADSEA